MHRTQPDTEHTGSGNPNPTRHRTSPDPGADRSVLDLIHALQKAEAARRRLPRGTRAYDDALAVEGDLRDRIRAWSDIS